MNNQHPWQLKKIYKFWQWIWSLNNFDFFQLPWVQIIHLSLFLLSIECPNFSYIIKSILGGVSFTFINFILSFSKKLTVLKKTNSSSNTLYSRAQEQQSAQWSGIVLIAKFQSIIRAGNHIGSIYWASLQPFIKSNQKL